MDDIFLTHNISNITLVPPAYPQSNYDQLVIINGVDINLNSTKYYICYILNFSYSKNGIIDGQIQLIKNTLILSDPINVSKAKIYIYNGNIQIKKSISVYFA